MKECGRIFCVAILFKQLAIDNCACA